MSEIKNNMAPKYEGITGELIKAIYKINKSLFIDILNKVWKSGKFPD